MRDRWRETIRFRQGSCAGRDNAAQKNAPLQHQTPKVASKIADAFLPGTPVSAGIALRKELGAPEVGQRSRGAPREREPQSSISRRRNVIENAKAYHW